MDTRCSKLARAAIAVVLAGSLLAPGAVGAAPAQADRTDGRVVAAAATTTGPDSMSVTRLYRAFFLRDADGGGLAYWQSHVRAGYPLAAVASDFARSAEFQTRYGSLGDGAFVDLVYRNVMGRAADEGGRAHWTGALRDRRLDRGGVMLSFSDSAEYKAKTGLIGTVSRLVITGTARGETRFVISDRSGRNLSPFLPALPERQIFVRLLHPVGADGRPRTDTALPVHVEGKYRSGSHVDCSAPYGDFIRACVGFPLMDQQAQIRWGDMANHAGDVGQVLDHLLSDPGLGGKVKADRIVYSGASMGGISGLYFAAAGPTHEPRIRAVASWVGFAPFSIPEITATVPWKAVPAVLMLNAHDDPDIPYELARRTVEHAGAGRIEVVTIRTGGHNPSCEAAWNYGGGWLHDHMFGTGAPSKDLLTGCAAAGLLPGGTTGYGLAGAFVRR